MKNKNIKKHNIPEIISPYFLPGTGIAGKYRHDAELLRDRGAVTAFSTDT